MIYYNVVDSEDKSKVETAHKKKVSVDMFGAKV